MFNDCLPKFNLIFLSHHQLIVSDDFFDNTLALNKMVVQKNLGMLGQPVDRNK